MTLCSRRAAQRAILLLDNHEVRPGKFLGVCVSLDNCRLFIGSIPRDKRRDDILQEINKVRTSRTRRAEPQLNIAKEATSKSNTLQTT